ncbi:MAG: HAMP domain-containing histidine kinase [Patescibacteria group bacterium]|nr:HAMP domain-containing histidine kinase [Patescibacteria group bacterium]MDE1965963.1 HAMP domain-containing histidine kinase [Patescibacteria group bacterium]
MPLWALFVLLFAVLASVSSLSTWAFATTVLTQLASANEYAFAVSREAFLVAVVLLAVAVLFFALGAFIAAPLRRLSAAVDEFSRSGASVSVRLPFGAPSEVRRLTSAFAAMAERVSAAHARDEEVSRVKSDFISTAAHQLRTPLTGIRWSLEALEQSELSADQRALVASATQKSKELVGIVKTLLDISSIESGKYHYAFAALDVRALLEEMARDFAPMANARNVSLMYVADAEPLPKVKADGERIKWVLNNLIENALRYTPGGGSVRITAEPRGGQLGILVRDTGIGIPSKDRDNIFQRFYRGENAIAKENAGNGLGLYIARTIAKDHGGDLEFRANDDGPGTTFILTLPLS